MTRSTTARLPHFGLDTNVMIYAVDSTAGDKSRLAESIIRGAVASRRCVLSLQNLGEFYHVCARKRHAAPEAAARRAADYSQLFAVTTPTIDDVRTALTEAASGRFSYWDALLLATLGRAGCTLLLSEDMRDGASLAGVTIRNPFDDARGHANHASILSSRPVTHKCKNLGKFDCEVRQPSLFKG